MADEFKELPSPSYEYEIEQLVSYYKRAVRDILRELERVDLTDFQRANAQAVLKDIADILAELDENAAAWVEENIPKAALDGVARAIVALGVVETLEEAKTIAKFNKLNRELVKAVVADTQSDLLAVTQNMNRKVKAAVRQTVAESMRSNMTKGINGRKTIRADIVAEMRKRLGDAVNTGIIDAAGRRWKPEVYAEMVTRTKMMLAHNEATRNEAIARGAYYAIISSHNAVDACRFHEGRIIKLTPDAPGEYPTYEQLRETGQIWHPMCRHVYTVFRSIDRLPDSVRERAEKQAELGNKAITTGKRNPGDI
jgi:Phage minor capsid protein 2